MTNRLTEALFACIVVLCVIDGAVSNRTRVEMRLYGQPGRDEKCR